MVWPQLYEGSRPELLSLDAPGHCKPERCTLQRMDALKDGCKIRLVQTVGVPGDLEGSG